MKELAVKRRAEDGSGSERWMLLPEAEAALASTALPLVAFTPAKPNKTTKRRITPVAVPLSEVAKVSQLDGAIVHDATEVAASEQPDGWVPMSQVANDGEHSSFYVSGEGVIHRPRA